MNLLHPAAADIEWTGAPTSRNNERNSHVHFTIVKRLHCPRHTMSYQAKGRQYADSIGDTPKFEDCGINWG